MGADELRRALARYAERLHAVAGDTHHVVSPLGAWLVLALCGSLGVSTQTTAALTESLGVDATEAAATARQLLEDPHPLVAAGAAVWMRPKLRTSGVDDWLDRLGAAVDTGDIPSTEELDRWASERTLGLIEQFPMRDVESLLVLMATALATRVSWEQPFEIVDASELGPTGWSLLRRVLRSPLRDPRHRHFIVDTDRAGTVAVHVTGARGGLIVGSVIAEDADVASGDVLVAAEQIVAVEAVRERGTTCRSLFDLPLGDGAVWTITEDQVETAAANGREERHRAVLPAWAAKTDVDLRDPSLGFGTAYRALGDAFGIAGPWEAKQAAVAKYDALGFEAAAVTGFAVLSSRPMTRPGHRRTATLRFVHPFAVVAAASSDRHVQDWHPTAWHGLPVFSAWVTEPSDAVDP